MDWRTFSHIGKLDGDIELPPDYFERVLERMRRDPHLGITGGSILEPTAGGGWRRIGITGGPILGLTAGGSWRRIGQPEYHVHGALKLFTRQCFEAVGGIRGSGPPGT